MPDIFAQRRVLILKREAHQQAIAKIDADIAKLDGIIDTEATARRNPVPSFGGFVHPLGGDREL